MLVEAISVLDVAQIEFDEGMAKQLEVLYNRRDVVRRRHLVREAVAAQPGEHVLDVGCGPGFYVAELLDEVGVDGSVTGVDVSRAMLDVAANRVEGRDNVAFHEAEATTLPVPDCAFDAAVSVQVLEYVPDVAAAVGEIHRVLRHGGRIVLWDVDWTTVSWHTADNARMRRMLDAWDHHLVHPSLPRTLTPRLHEVGFADVTAHGHAFVTNALDPETYGGSMMGTIAQYAVQQGGVDAADAEAWKAEQKQLAARGEFYFACTQVCFGARKR
jgi:ubiquinone/menaquinone biosynthesis C-methylase UbiE